MHRPLVMAAALATANVFCPAGIGAQSTATVPPVCLTLPGNAAVSMPLRWSHGAMQVFVDAPLLPAGFVGNTITGVRLRRSTLPGDTAYPALQRTLTVRGAFQSPPAAAMIGGLTQNRPASTQILFGPAVVAVPATPAPGPATTTGDEFVVIPFTTPLPVTAGTLFLEFEAGDPPLQVGTGHWVDAVWLAGGSDSGLVVAVGDGSCTTRPEPTRLAWTAAHGPAAGSTAEVTVTGAPPTAGASTGLVLFWVGTEPETRPPGAGYLGYGASFATLDPTMVDCHQWAPLDVAWFGVTDAAGACATTFAIPGSVAIGQRLAAQAAWFDPSRPVLPLSLANGLQLVCRGAGVSNRCNTLFFPGAATVSPWPPFVGQMPVLLLEY